MRLAILAYDQISPFMLSTPLAVFGEPFLASGHRVDVCAAQPRFSATGGLTIEAPMPLAAARNADVVILPGWRAAEEPVPAMITSELRAAEERGAIVVGLCLGAFGLAEAGLLDGRRATTHWACVESFATRYPEVAVDPGALFVDEGRILTSAGVASGLDCCLHLLGRLSGAAEANRIARHLVVAPQRAGEQPQLIERPAIGSSADRRITDILERLRADPASTPSLDELALRAGMSRRSLTRHIRARTGGSLGDWLRRVRLARAQDLLAGGARGLDDVAARCGFPDAAALRTAFRAELRITPRQWLARQRLD
ncbi:transcriptional regulator GlxA family with amidase domain [Rhodopseudomonas thermotolerans]|uniref:Transcriptional regulator GlxA family with amidase domain n=2 Tax=Rhodopseudomonas TaxID=1073 RepID=A0A336JZM9_9BRAD|nr:MULTISPECIES: helix-turn-helix domain-containing protein [Rhodopseudomonas]RED32586.1 transcriptional regulator GlxA family with amidase domain [Rhodopseudomonas pentothenatexigens]REF93596.1 transcriptional regulator GlxA family with amidase domain [Rhodopseudomonas thermotolerans]SSW91481.1 transcriptional regulator GlxA family with amidase domain [Rhodopseudomonas pentothenatexigens]